MTSSESQPRTIVDHVHQFSIVFSGPDHDRYSIRPCRCGHTPRAKAADTASAQPGSLDVERLALFVKDEIHRVFCLNAKHRSPFTGLCGSGAAKNIARGLVARLAAEEPHD